MRLSGFVRLGGAASGVSTPNGNGSRSKQLLFQPSRVLLSMLHMSRQNWTVNPHDDRGVLSEALGHWGLVWAAMQGLRSLVTLYLILVICVNRCGAARQVSVCLLGRVGQASCVQQVSTEHLSGVQEICHVGAPPWPPRVHSRMSSASPHTRYLNEVCVAMTA